MNTALPRLLLGLGLLAAIATAIVLRDRFDTSTLRAWVDAAGVAGPLLFVVAYAVATVLFLPGSVITLAGGALFGPVWGTLWNLSGATLGAAAAFLIARYLGTDWVARRAGPRLSRLNEGVAAEGWKFVAFVRLVPLFPFNLLNYALGLTRVSFGAYVLASWVFMLPGAIAYTWLGYAGREALGGGEGLVRNLIIALALVAVTIFVPRWVRKARHEPMMSVEALRQQLDAHVDVLVLDVRTAAEFDGDSGHISGAHNLPVEAMPQRWTELEAHRQRAIRLVCGTDRRSAQAARLLAERGFADARVVQGGMKAWLERGYPTART
jgi:uncharacterized membrane protein YdjX (TVP38/TMEM64 family)